MTVTTNEDQTPAQPTVRRSSLTSIDADDGAEYHPGMLTVPDDADDLSCLLAANKRWAQQVHEHNPAFFEQGAAGQSPKILWIGCADSRVPESKICDLAPGEVFVHRNIANVVPYNDVNILSILQYAVEVLKVKHIVVCGHYGCGGVAAAMTDTRFGLIDNWLRYIKDTYHTHRKRIDAHTDRTDKANALVELNVVQSVLNVAHSGIVQDAWARGQPLKVYGWVYRLEDGVIQDLNVCIDSQEKIAQEFRYRA
ncbi:hypothetical protein RI367_007128 [Sorochytrium milnesiophthora]